MCGHEYTVHAPASAATPREGGNQPPQNYNLGDERGSGAATGERWGGEAAADEVVVEVANHRI